MNVRPVDKTKIRSNAMIKLISFCIFVIGIVSFLISISLSVWNLF